MLVKLNAVQTLGLACAGVATGSVLRRTIPALARWHVPGPVIGGLACTLALLLLRTADVQVEMDTILQSIAMIAFFTTVGLGASWGLLRRGGPQVAVLLGLATLGAVLQNLLGAGLAKALGISPLVGVIAGAVTLAGGPATALAFGKTFEEFGVTGAATIGVACAMFGILVAGVTSGAVGGALIRSRERASAHEEVGGAATEAKAPLLPAVVLVGIAMALGTLVSAGLETLLRRWGFFLPGYIGAMIAAAVLRNLNDRFHLFPLSPRRIEEVGIAALSIFIAMALLTLKLWELRTLAGPLLLILLAQIALVLALCRWLCPRFLGGDYEGAVMTAGYCGFMLGTTANAVAAMSVLTARYGPAPRAFLTVPVVGAFLIDFTNSLVITVTANLLR